MSRSLDHDFDDDDPVGGSLDLEKGSQAGAGGMGTGSSNYDGGGVDLDEDPFGDGSATAGPLELDLPPASAPALRAAARPGLPDLAVPAPSPGPPSPPRPPGAVPPAAPVPEPHPQPTMGSPVPSPESGLHREAQPSGKGAEGWAPPPPAPRPAAALLANYPAAPPQVWQAPKYAIQIVLRQFELRSLLESLRRRRSPDVPLYEAALRSYDARTFRLGMAINAAILTIAILLFFLPVILRFARAD